MAENQKLIAVLHEIAAEQNLRNYEIKLTPISSGGANYTSHLFTIVISSQDKDLHLFAKVSAFGDKMREVTGSINIYDTEKYICTELKDAFKRLEDKNGLEEKHRFQMPKFYGANTTPPEEVVVFEDLSSRGFTTYDRMKSISWKYGAAVCAELAKLHSLSMAYQQEHPDQFKKTCDLLNFDMEEIMKMLWEGSKKTALGAVREENKERLSNYMNEIDKDAFGTYFHAKKREVLMHGDFRISNIMHRDREDGSVEVIPVDYQTIRAGSPLVDLYYFIFTGTDAKFRAQYYDKLIEHYFSELRDALTRLGLNPEDIYSREDFEFELKDKLLYGLAVAVSSLPFITVEAEDAPRVDENMDMKTFNVNKTGNLFPERLNGVVDDYIRWGAL